MAAEDSKGIDLRPIGSVRGGRKEIADDYWGGVRSCIELDPEQFGPDALRGLDEFSHLEVVFLMDRVPDDQIVTGARHPRERLELPVVGIFAGRSKHRPNRIGVSRCRIVSVEGLSIEVEGLDALDGSPVLDVKPWVREFAPIGWVRQPDWVYQVLQDYYKKEKEEKPLPRSRLEKLDRPDS